MSERDTIAALDAECVRLRQSIADAEQADRIRTTEHNILVRENRSLASRLLYLRDDLRELLHAAEQESDILREALSDILADYVRPLTLADAHAIAQRAFTQANALSPSLEAATRRTRTILKTYGFPEEEPT